MPKSFFDKVAGLGQVFSFEFCEIFWNTFFTEHLRASASVFEHLLCCNYSPSFEDFSILTRESNDFKLKIMESLLIARDKPILNKADSSLPLELF